MRYQTRIALILVCNVMELPFYLAPLVKISSPGLISLFSFLMFQSRGISFRIAVDIDSELSCFLHIPVVG